MFVLQRNLIVTLYLLLVSTVLSGEMKLLSDIELATMMAQYELLETKTQNRYENIQLENLFLTQNLLKDRLINFNNLNDTQQIDSDALVHQIETSLVSLSTQIASTITLSALFPVFGLPVGIGMSSVPSAFEIEVTGVSIDLNMSIEIRE